jgi:hypothetical protein
MNFLYVPLLTTFLTFVYGNINTEGLAEYLSFKGDYQEQTDKSFLNFLEITKTTINQLVQDILNDENIGNLPFGPKENVESISFFLNQFKRYSTVSILTGKMFFSSKTFFGYKGKIEEIREELKKVT